jgi:hypothetical protein
MNFSNRFMTIPFSILSARSQRVCSDKRDAHRRAARSSRKGRIEIRDHAAARDQRRTTAEILIWAHPPAIASTPGGHRPSAPGVIG